MTQILAVEKLQKRLEKAFISSKRLKADRPYPHCYPYEPPDYRHTDKHLQLVMTFIHAGEHRQTNRQTLPSALSPSFAKASRSIKMPTSFYGHWKMGRHMELELKLYKVVRKCGTIVPKISVMETSI